MARRWVWSALDLLALICLGQACLIAQRQAQPREEPAAARAPAALTKAEQDFGRVGTRIYETQQSIVVAVKVAAQGERGLGVSVDQAGIRLSSRASARLQEIPLPSGADPARFTVRRVADELRIVFARSQAQSSRGRGA